MAQGESSIRILSYPELELVHEITQDTDPGATTFRPAFSPDGTRFYTINHTTPITRRSKNSVWKGFSGTLNIYETTRWTKIAEEENCFPVLAVAPGGEPIFQTLKQDPETGEFTGSKSWAMLRQSDDGAYDRIPVYQNLDTNLDSIFTQPPGFNRLATKSSYNESSWKIWDTSNPTNVQLQSVIESHGFPTIDRTGRYLVTLRLEDETTVMLHDLNEAKTIDLESPKSDNELFAMRAVFSDDGTRLIASTLNRMLHIWETKTGKHLETIPGQPELIHAMVAVGSHVTCLYGSGKLRTWDTSKTHDSVFQQTTIPLLSENTYLLDRETEQRGSDLIERIHPELRAQFEAGTLPWRLPRPISYALNRRFQTKSSQHILSPNGQFIGIITYNWDYDSLEEFPESRRLKLPKGKRVAAKYEIPRTIRFYDLNDNGRLVVEWQLRPERNVPTIDLPGYSGIPQFLDDYRLIVEVDKKAELWDLRSKKRQTLSVEEPTPGRWIFLGRWADISGSSLLLNMGEPGGSGSVFLWNVDTDRQQIRFPCFGTPRFSPNGQHVLIDEWHPRQSSIFQSTTGERMHDLQGHRLPTKSFFSPDGKTILTVTDGNKQIPSLYQLWNAATGRKITQIDRDIRTDLAWNFSLDGTSLYSYEETYIYKLGLPNVEKAELHLLSLPKLETIDAEMDAEK